MKISTLFLFVAFVLLAMTAFMPMPVLALSYALQDPEPAFSLDKVFESVKNAVGFALLLPALFNAGKAFGWVQDGDAPKFSLVFNTGVLVLFVYLQLSSKANLIPVVDQSAGMFANVLATFTLLLAQLFASRKVHEEVLAGLPIIGTSFSHRLAGEGAAVEIVQEEAKASEFDEDKLKDFRGTGY